MSYRAIIFYLVAAILLGGIYLYEIRQDKKKAEVQEAGKSLLKMPSDSLESIVIKRETGTITLQKKVAPHDKNWEITAPIYSAADNAAVQSLLNKLADLKYTRIIAENSGDLAQFGLDHPMLIITYKTATASGKLTFGSESPIEYSFYATKDDLEKVYLISVSDKKILDKDLFELMDKRLFTLEPEKVKRFIIEREATKWVILSKKGRWVFEDDDVFRIDQKRVNSLVTSISWAQALSFEKEAAIDLDTFGLKSPKARITISDGKKREQIVLGSISKENDTRLYAMMEGRPQLVLVGRWLLDSLPQNREAIKE
jgi:hypothetical protein